jgi:hypothetical protein
MKIFHQAVGLTVLVMAKYNYISTLVRKDSDLLWIFIGWESLCLFWYVKMKLFSNKLTTHFQDTELTRSE